MNIVIDSYKVLKRTMIISLKVLINKKNKNSQKLISRISKQKKNRRPNKLKQKIKIYKKRLNKINKISTLKQKKNKIK